MIELLKFKVSENSLQGPIPHAFGSMIALQFFLCGSEQLERSHSTFSWLHDCIAEFLFASNIVQGPIPHAVSSMIALRLFSVLENSLCGPIPNGIGSMTSLKSLDGSENSLQGRIPHAVGTMLALDFFAVARNRLSGTIRAAMTCSMGLTSAHGNHKNRLTSSLPALKDLGMLVASGNFLEGRIPYSVT